MKKTPLHRRDFLRGSLAAGAGLATLGGLDPLQQLSYAQQTNPDAPDRYYIFCYFSGGWDVLLGLDPRDPRDFPSETESLRHSRIQPGYETLQHIAPPPPPERLAPGAQHQFVSTRSCAQGNGPDGR